MNNAAKIGIVVALVIAVGVVIVVKRSNRPAATSEKPSTQTPEPLPDVDLPRLLDVGAGTCIPCKLMKPILEELRTEHAGRLRVDYIDVRESADAAEMFEVRVIPTQIFFSAGGDELFRHEGFMSKETILAKWKELGIDLAPPPATIRRETPLAKDSRPRDQVCSMCDGDIAPKTRVSIKTQAGQVALCSPHCFFIFYSSLKEKGDVERRATVTDWATGKPTPAMTAACLYGVDEAGCPTIKAFADKGAAEKEQRASGGNVLTWEPLRAKELATTCGFCDRAVYPEDACSAKAGGAALYGCGPMCGLGVAARLQQDIELEAKDALTGEAVRVATLNGGVRSLEPSTAVAWHGQKKSPEGKMVSAGCFKQFFFTSEAHLKQWLDKHPEATGKLVTIHQALAGKMTMTPAQIKNACKIGECK